MNIDDHREDIERRISEWEKKLEQPGMTMMEARIIRGKIENLQHQLNWIDNYHPLITANMQR